MKIIFIKSPILKGYGYHIGETVEMDSKEAEKLIGAGIAEVNTEVTITDETAAKPKAKKK